MPDSIDYESSLAHQLAMNKETWAALQRHGFTDQSKVRLDFTYLAPSRGFTGTDPTGPREVAMKFQSGA